MTFFLAALASLVVETSLPHPYVLLTASEGVNGVQALHSHIIQYIMEECKLGQAALAYAGPCVYPAFFFATSWAIST